MAEIKIDSLSMKLSGLSEREGERLARLVADDLGAANFPATASHHVETMKVQILSSAGSDLNRLSKQIVAEMLRQLARNL